MQLSLRKTVLLVAIASASVSAEAGCSDNDAGAGGGDSGTGQGGHGGAPSGHTSNSTETGTGGQGVGGQGVGGQGVGGQGAGGQEVPPDPSALAFSSGSAEHDAAYTKAVAAISADIDAGKFLAGESWPQVWTRDTSYSIDLGAGLLQPAVSKATLEGMTEDVPEIGSVWVQDVAGHFGG